jgi:hypothetical protein
VRLALSNSNCGVEAMRMISHGQEASGVVHWGSEAEARRRMDKGSRRQLRVKDAKRA